jgi:hypothetical protein
MYPAHFTVEFYGKFSWEKATVTGELWPEDLRIFCFRMFGVSAPFLKLLLVAIHYQVTFYHIFC